MIWDSPLLQTLAGGALALAGGWFQSERSLREQRKERLLGIYPKLRLAVNDATVIAQASTKVIVEEENPESFKYYQDRIKDSSEQLKMLEPVAAQLSLEADWQSRRVALLFGSIRRQYHLLAVAMEIYQERVLSATYVLSEIEDIDQAHKELNRLINDHFRLLNTSRTQRVRYAIKRWIHKHRRSSPPKQEGEPSDDS